MSFARTLVKLSAFQGNSGADSIPYTSENVPYGNDSSTGNNVKAALDALFAAIYPNTKPSVETPADLPLTGNDIRDYRMVLDDGDGKAAGYRWESREGDSAPKWYKVHDMDWSNDAILSAFLDQTLDIYASKYGRMDLDADGNPITGKFAGQSIYGGTDANSNLTLNANSGDSGSAPEDQTGYIQFNDDLRPTFDSSIDLGTAIDRFRNLFLTGNLSNGTDEVSVAELKAAYDHSQLTDENPHNTSYDQLSTKLGTITFSGDVEDVELDLSDSGDKSVELVVKDFSHQHEIADIVDFTDGVYEASKEILKNQDGALEWQFDDVLKTITPQLSEDTTIAPPASNKILAGNADGDAWEAVDGNIELTGDLSGTGSYDSTEQKWELEATVENVPLDKIDRFILDNKIFDFTPSASPTTLSMPQHGMRTGELVRLFNVPFAGFYEVTVPGPDEVRINRNTAAYPATEGYYIPAGAHLSYAPDLDKFRITNESENIRLGDLSGLNEDVLDQYVNKNGRPDGQTIQGGISEYESLVLESTAHATKGLVETKDTFAPHVGAAFSGGNWQGTDLGTSGKKFRDIHMSGEAKGLRVENLSSEPTTSAQNAGRLFTIAGELLMDTGAAIKRLFSIPSLTGKAGQVLLVNEDEDELELRQVTDKDILVTAQGLNMTLEEAIVQGLIGGGVSTANATTQVNGSIATANVVTTHTVPTDAIGFKIQGNKGNLDLEADVYFTFSPTDPDAANKTGYVLESSRDMETFYVKHDVKVVSTVVGAKYTLTWLRKVI